MLAWLSILAYKNKGSEKLVTVEDIAMQHWKKFGRNFFRCTPFLTVVQCENNSSEVEHTGALPPGRMSFCISAVC